MDQALFCAMIAGQAKPGMEDYVRDHLVELMHRSSNEDGCILYHVHESADKSGEFMVYMLWQNQEAFEKHNATAHMQEFKKKLAAEWFMEQSPKTYWRIL